MRRKIVTICFLLFGVLMLAPSCDDNSKSLGNFRISIATVVSEGQNAYSLLLDDGTRLWPVASDVRYSPSNNQRVFLNYTILENSSGEYDYNVKVNEIWNILTKKVIALNDQNKDSIGNDPIKTNAVWVGGDYLNVSFMFNYGFEKPHLINLVENELVENDSQEELYFEFRHNSYQSTHSKLFEGFVCFDLKPFRTDDADSVKLAIKVKGLKGDITYDVVYRYNQPALESILRMPPPVISSKEYY